MPESIHETDICAQVATAAEILFREKPDLCFKSAEIEGFGRGALRRKRTNLRFYAPSGVVVLTGEVGLPGTPKGRSPYAVEWVQDAHQKADNANARYFFTWNVKTFVLWDRKLWNVPLLERKVREWRLGLDLARPQDVARPEVLDHIKTRFLPGLLADLSAIITRQ